VGLLIAGDRFPSLLANLRFLSVLPDDLGTLREKIPVVSSRSRCSADGEGLLKVRCGDCGGAVGDWPLSDRYAGLAVEMDSGPARCEYESAVGSLLDPSGGSLSFIADDCLEEAMSLSGMS
jgi:hypothetical protein